MALFTGTAATVVPVHDERPEELLKQADSLKTSNYAESVAIVQKLGESSMKLSPEQKMYRRYLSAWQVAYRGNYVSAIPELDTVIAESDDVTLRFRAGVTVVNLLGIASRYQEAFARLSQLLDQLPQVTDKAARMQGLATAAQLYIEAGQYDLASNYADQLIKENPTDEVTCKGRYLNLEAIYQSGRMRVLDEQKYQDGINACVKAGEHLYANEVRSRLASFEIQQGQLVNAIRLLQKNYAEVQSARYARLISQFNALLAQAYWNEADITSAKQYALNAVGSSVKNEYTEPLVTAYGLLYRIEKKQGDLASALAYHEKYMAADKGYLNEVSAKALAYQIVEQQVQAKKQQVDALSKQNKILELQQQLDHKAMVTSRLYILLLLLGLAFIVLWSFRLRRSQLSFMKQARRDGLTGIYNRQHFLEEAERQLRYCARSAREASLVLIDLDHFKRLNDTYGHAVGDRVLRHAVQACQAHLRSTDIFGRLGGEEFGILLPECSLEQVSGRVEQLRLAIASVADDDIRGAGVSASFGVATTAQSGCELRQLLIHADDALYQAKNSGRNRAVVFDVAMGVQMETMRKARGPEPVAEHEA